MLPTTLIPSSAKFQLAVPHLLAPVSPSLAALHATRARLLYPADAALSGTHCAYCGYPITANHGQTRSVRQKRKRGGPHEITRVLWRSCRTCGHIEEIPLGAARAPAFPKPRDRARRSLIDTNKPHASGVAITSSDELTSSIPMKSAQPRSSQPVSSSSTPAPSGAATSIHAISSTQTLSRASPQDTPSTTEQGRMKHRQKKRAGLQNMLARNRERQEQEKKRESGQREGLSAFLQGF